jgi:hypothetical protein
MALISKLEAARLDRDAPHKAVRCTFSIVTGESGERYLQLDTYGSSVRKLRDKKSQSLRFTSDAVSQLMAIIRANNF